MCPMWQPLHSYWLVSSTTARAVVMPDDGDRGVATTLAHALGQANRSIMAREGGGAGGSLDRGSHI